MNYLQIFLHNASFVFLILGLIYWIALIIGFFWWCLNWLRLKFIKHGTYQSEIIQSNSEAEHAKAPSVIWIVHGTFARNADWHKLNSGFINALKKVAGHCEIRLFKWSGINSFSARKKAGLALLKEIKEVGAKGCQMRIIGHSHGGTIGSWAVSQFLSNHDRKMTKEPDAKVISLGMPVITSTKETNVYYKSLDLIVSVLLLSPILYIFAETQIMALGFELQTDLFLLGMELDKNLSLIVFLLATLLLYVIRMVARRQLPKSTDIISSDYFDKNNLKLIRAVGDEAASAITTLYVANMLIQQVGNLPTFLLKKSKIPSKYGVRRLTSMTLGLFFISSAIIFGLYILNTSLSPQYQFNISDDAINIIAYLWFAFFLLAILLIIIFLMRLKVINFFIQALAAIVVSPFIVVMHAVAGLACGPESSLVGSWRQFTAEPAPIGEWNLTVREPDPESPTLRHNTGLSFADIYRPNSILLEIAEELK